jgi:peptide/nickel transport system substrate-binding protein
MMRAARVAAVCVLAALVSCGGHEAQIRRYDPGARLEGPRTRGGHLVLVREEDPDFLDPALSYGVYSAPMVQSVFRSLIDYAHVPGPAGAALVPDLAESLPDIREGGTLFCFRVRKDARFGAPLHRHITAQDFRYALQRLFRVNCPGVTFYRHIVGAEAVLAGQSTDLAGVIARGDSLYIRIEKPDPVFPYLLALAFTAPIPEDVDRRWPHAFSQHTVSCGPYEVAEFTPRRRIMLVRNPEYCGTPAWIDTIEIRFGVTSANAVALIRRGVVDGGFFEVPGAEYARLKRDPLWGRQIQLADGLNTEYLWMNVRKKPFNDPRVRQAVAWALNRRAVLKVWSGKGEIAGEFLPPGMPGVSRLGRYLTPDPERAKALLRDAGYPNGFVTKLYGWTTEPGPRELTVVQEQLAEIGIRAQLDLGETAGYTTMASDTSRHIPFGVYSWYADYVDPSNFFDTLLNGHRIEPRENQNLSLFDDAAVNAEIERAMSTVNDSARMAIYRHVDEMVMDESPVVPMIHVHESRIYNPRVGGWYRHVTRILKLEDLYLKPPRAPIAGASGGAH